MSDPKRRFFSGDSLQRVLVEAANHFGLEPSQVAYRSIEKKHGFLKTQRKVVIEVDPEHPRRTAEAPPAPPPVAEAAAAQPPVPRPERPMSQAPLPAGPERREREGRRHDPGRPRGREREGRERDRPRGGVREQRGTREPRETRGTRDTRGAQRGAVPERRERQDLVALPEVPRRPSERYPLATGPEAEAAASGLELLLRVAGLRLEGRIHQGEDRLEVELSGEDAGLCSEDEGELLLALEHLLPRLVRSASGESLPCRVDCDNFHEIREERLRSLAQRVAGEVRRAGRPQTLEPMNPADRRMVHMTLADDPAVVTESDGDGYYKRIIVRPV